MPELISLLAKVDFRISKLHRLRWRKRLEQLTCTFLKLGIQSRLKVSLS